MTMLANADPFDGAFKALDALTILGFDQDIDQDIDLGLLKEMHAVFGERK